MENCDLNLVVSKIMMAVIEKTCNHYEKWSDKQLARVTIWSFMKKFVDELHDTVASTCKDYGVDEEVDMTLSKDFMKVLRAGIEAHFAAEPTD